MRRLRSGLWVGLALTLGCATGVAAEKEEGEGAAPAVASAEGTDAAPTREWNQEEVTELASGLADGVKGLRKAARQMPPDNIASGQSRARMHLVDQMRLIERETRSLHSELVAGAGRDETRPIFRRIDGMRRSAGEEARRMFFPQSTLDQLKAARAFIEELRPYYGGAPDTRPDLHGPSKTDE